MSSNMSFWKDVNYEVINIANLYGMTLVFKADTTVLYLEKENYLVSSGAIKKPVAIERVLTHLREGDVSLLKRNGYYVFAPQTLYVVADFISKIYQDCSLIRGANKGLTADIERIQNECFDVKMEVRRITSNWFLRLVLKLFRIDIKKLEGV